MSATRDDLRPSYTTPRLKLPVPGDAAPADYVTDTGALADRLDLVGVPPCWAHASLPASGGLNNNTFYVVGFTSLGEHIEPVPGHEWLDADTSLRVPLPGIYDFRVQAHWSGAGAGEVGTYIFAPDDVGGADRSAFHYMSGNIEISFHMTATTAIKPGQSILCGAWHNTAIAKVTRLIATIMLAVPLTEKQVDDLQGENR